MHKRYCDSCNRQVRATPATALNAICAYFTMFPIEFPHGVLERASSSGDWVLDPFCGRGTTNYAARLLGFPSIGIDSSPVAVALAQSKLANVTPDEIISEARSILDSTPTVRDMPSGEFWDWAYKADVLQTLCRLREGLLHECHSDAAIALRAILLGALHGPLKKEGSSYFSNQAPRTYAPKPRYAVNYWRSRGLNPPAVGVMDIIRIRAEHYYGAENSKGAGQIVAGDSRSKSSWEQLDEGVKAQWVITSPPYYGMTTYLPDQWLRLWFVGGESTVHYGKEEQIGHSSPSEFANQLRDVWTHAGQHCQEGAQLVVRFGGINDRKADPLTIIKDSFNETDWKIARIENAGSASHGRRQALHFATAHTDPREEHDLWATWAPS
jgi:DNA methylase